MSLVLDIQKQLHSATHRVVELERALLESPDVSVEGNLESAVRIQRKLIAQFREAASKASLDIFTYRAFDDNDTQKAAPSFQAVADFQTLFSVVHSALKSGGRKLKATYDEQVARETSFGFGYAMAGSIEVVLTVENEQLLFGQKLDHTADVVFELTQSRTPQEIHDKAAQLGPGPINALYQWARDNTFNGLGAELTWRKGEKVERTVVMQRQHMRELKSAIYQTSAETPIPFSCTGKMVAVNLKAHKFTIERQGLPDMKGSFEPGIINDSHEARLPHMYEYDMLRIVSTTFRTGQQRARYHMLRLRELPAKDSPNDKEN
jgi:hypothetical protein